MFILDVLDSIFLQNLFDIVWNRPISLQNINILEKIFTKRKFCNDESKIPTEHDEFQRELLADVLLRRWLFLQNVLIRTFYPNRYFQALSNIFIKVFFSLL